MRINTIPDDDGIFMNLPIDLGIETIAYFETVGVCFNLTSKLSVLLNISIGSDRPLNDAGESMGYSSFVKNLVIKFICSLPRSLMRTRMISFFFNKGSNNSLYMRYC